MHHVITLDFQQRGEFLYTQLTQYKVDLSVSVTTSSFSLGQCEWAYTHVYTYYTCTKMQQLLCTINVHVHIYMYACTIYMYIPCNEHVDDRVNDEHEENISNVEIIVQRDVTIEVVPCHSLSTDL